MFLPLNRIIIIVVLPFFISFLFQFFFIKLSLKKTLCIDCPDTYKPQGFHNIPTPRAGGLGIFLSLVISFWLLINSKRLSFINLSPTADYFFQLTIHQSFILSSLLLSSLPAFLAGFYEDLRSNIKPKLRLFIMSIGAIMAIVSMNAIVYDIGVIKLPLWIAIPFTIFAVVGVTNAINIIDGFNGLTGGVSIIALLSFSIASYIQGDQLILNISLIFIFTLLGFFVLNFPKGKIFLGDGGAYLIGFSLAELSVLFVKRNPDISPWFPLVILAYPVFDTLFSIYRRSANGSSALKADKLHFHSLIYKSISRNNPKTSIYIWSLVAFLNGIALLFRSSTAVLILIFIIFSLTYVYLYRKVMSFETKEIYLPVEIKLKP
jgi:UDP-N-acetylmuramyl pentapeptide phosphotransferase/UDP-N-acetylglucosamine-1-phosphate transferase